MWRGWGEKAGFGRSVGAERQDHPGKVATVENLRDFMDR